MKQAIIVLTDANGNLRYFGPFIDGEDATSWGFVNCKGFEWHWEELWPVNEPITEAAKHGL